MSSTTLALIELGVIIVLVVALVLMTAQFSRTLQSTLVHADSIHARSNEHIGHLTDRLMAMDFATYKAYAMAEGAEPGGMELPNPEDLEDERPWIPPDRQVGDDE